MSDEVKRCRACREIKPLSDFTMRRDGSGKHAIRCDECENGKRNQKRNESQSRQSERQSNKPQRSSTLKRTPIKQVSDKRREVNKQRKEVLENHFGPRDKWVCSVPHLIPTRCWGAVNGHEILSRARAGRTDENLLDVSGIILVCNHHNTWIEDNPAEASALGLTKHSWE